MFVRKLLEPPLEVVADKLGPGQVIREVHTKKLDAPDSISVPSMCRGAWLSTCILLMSTIISLVLLMLRQRLLSLHHLVKCFYLISVGRLIAVRDEAQDGGVISELKDDVGAVFSNSSAWTGSTVRGWELNPVGHPCSGSAWKRARFQFSSLGVCSSEYPKSSCIVA